MHSVAILESGIVSAVGFNAASTCAAIRCAIDQFAQTRFVDDAGEWVIGSPVELPRPYRGLDRLVHLLVPAIQECLTLCGNAGTPSIPLLLCVAERDRPGRLEGLDDLLFRAVVERLGSSFHPASVVIPRGRVAGALGMTLAGRLLHEERVPLCLLAGVDSLLIAETLASYEERRRLLTSSNSNGFIPGEAGAAVLLGLPGNSAEAELVCVGLGSGHERVTVESEGPLRADGMTGAFRAALAASTMSFADLHYRLTDLNGEQYAFKEAGLAFSRSSRTVKESFELWHPADCLGEIGAAIGPCVFGVALAAARKQYAPGPNVLCHFAGDNEERMAAILSYRLGRAA